MSIENPRGKHGSVALLAVLLMLVIVGAPACTTTYQGTNLEPIDKLQPGATKADVVKLLGVPDSVRKGPDSGKILVYNSAFGEGSGFGIGSIAKALFLLERVHVSQETAQVTVDAEGRVVDAFRTDGPSRVTPWPFD